MPVVNIREYDETVVLHFGTDGSRLSAYTLATTLVAVADAAKAANAIVNPGFEIEVVVEALGSGSFKAQIRAVYHGAGNLFSKENLKAIVISVIASYIYSKAFDPQQAIQVNVHTDEVVIQQGDRTIVVPREVHEATARASQVPEFRDGISRVFQAVQNDQDVRYVSIAPTMDDSSRGPLIPRERFPAIAEGAIIEHENAREILETTDLQITRAILERGRKRWQFVWRGIRISAPVLDEHFYDRFFAREITVAPGDALKVRLRLRQNRDPDTGVFLNDPNGYEVLEVLEHRPRSAQSSASFGSR